MIYEQRTKRTSVPRFLMLDYRHGRGFAFSSFHRQFF